MVRPAHCHRCFPEVLDLDIFIFVCVCVDLPPLSPGVDYMRAGQEDTIGRVAETHELKDVLTLDYC
ncbi:hypothetical protein Bpfe_009812, partial [Biomphalaria pfeifferi]